MKYLTLKDLQPMYEKYGNVLDIALKILGANDSETLAWYCIGKDVMKRRDREKMEKLEEWFQELQQSMFGDNLPEPKPKDINRLIGPPQFLSHVELQDHYKNIINPLFLPYMSYFTLSGLAYWYHALSTIFLFDEIKPKKLMFGACISSYIVDYLKEEEQIIEEEKNICEKCVEYGKCGKKPFVNLKVRNPELIGYIKDHSLAQEIWDITSEDLMYSYWKRIKSLKKKYPMAHAALLDDAKPVHVFNLAIVNSNLLYGNLQAKESLKASLLFDLISSPRLIEEEKEFFLPTYKILGIDLNDYLNQLAFAVKRIVFHK